MDKSIDSNSNNKINKFNFSPLTLQQLRQKIDDFAMERNWQQFHQPRNILLALIGELGEISENFQWKPDSDCDHGLPKWTEHERIALADELSDVFIYLIRLADRCRIDVSKTISQH